MDGGLTRRPDDVLERPTTNVMTEDVLSDVLRAIRLTGAVFFDFHVTAPWAAAAPASREIAAAVMPGAQRVIEYHLIARGRCWARTNGQMPVQLEEGDLIMFPQGDAHILSSAPGMEAQPDLALFNRQNSQLPLVVEFAGGGVDQARIVCGFLGCDERPYNPLLSALPHSIHISARDSASARWLTALGDVAAKESRTPRPGSENVLARVSELMFVEALRQYLETLPPSQSGWLAGVRDPLVGRALAAMHGKPTEAWTVERLARDAGTSRSVMAERFAGLLGHPPMHYLALWRMQLASGMLTDGRPIGDVAGAVGYESEAAFSRAFKKLVGESPATWRRGRKSPTVA